MRCRPSFAPLEGLTQIVERSGVSFVAGRGVSIFPLNLLGWIVQIFCKQLLKALRFAPPALPVTYKGVQANRSSKQLTVTKHETSVLVLQCPCLVKQSRGKFTILDMAVDKI